MNDNDKDIVCILGLLLSPVLLGYVLPTVVMEIGYILFNGKSPMSLLVLVVGVLITAIVLILFFDSRDNTKGSNSKKEKNDNGNNEGVKWKKCAKCGRRINIVAKKCPYCRSTTFTEYHEPKPIKKVVEKPRTTAHNPRLYERQKELAKKYNQNNYKNLTRKPEEKKRVEEMKKVKEVYKVCPNCNHKQGKTNKICPNCYYEF